MAVDDLINGSDDGSGIPDGATVGQLKKMYGEKVVERALQYMQSLPEANERFKQSAQKDAEKYSDGIIGWFSEDEEADNKSEIEESWADGMEDGLGIDE